MSDEQNKPVAFDLADLVGSNTTTIALEHPKTGQPLPVKVTIYSSDSPTFLALERKQRDARLSRIANKGKVVLTSDELDAENMAVLVACTAGWEGVLWNGAPLPFTPDNAKMVYTKLPWMAEQVNKAIGDRGNFLKSEQPN